MMTDERRMEKNAYCRAWRIANPEKTKGYDAAHREAKHEIYIENRDAVLAYCADYYATHKAEKAAYYAANREKILAYHWDYNAANSEELTAKSLAYQAKHPEQSRTNFRKHSAKHRTLGFIPLNQPFEGCNGHHVDRERVVYIPEVLHMSIRHNVWNGRNMDKINAVAFDYLSKQEVAQ